MEGERVPNNYPGELEEEHWVELEGRPDAHRQLFLDAGRLLMLWGWGALAAVVSAAPVGRSNGRWSAAVHAFLALSLWLLGASLVALVPVARRFPRAARVGVAAANAAIAGFIPPRN